MPAGVGGEGGGELHALCLPFWWKWAPLWVFSSQVFFLSYYLFCERLFLQTALGGWLIILSTLFIFNLTWKKCFLESTLPWWIFDKYLILHQFSCLLNINSALGM